MNESDPVTLLPRSCATERPQLAHRDTPSGAARCPKLLVNRKSPADGRNVAIDP